MPTSVSPTRRIAAIGAVLALVVALVAIAVAVGKAVEGGGGNDRAGTGPSGAAASVAPQEDAGQQKMFDDIARRTIRRQDGDPLAIGRKDAPVVLVEYADYQCSFCGRFTRETQPELVKKFVDEGTLRIEFRNFPIKGADSERAARASWAAGRQGKFRELHEALFARSRKGEELSEDGLVGLARESGVPDIDKFRADLKSPAAQAAVGKDQEEGYQLGVQSTPSFLVNGRPIAGAQSAEVFAQAVREAEARADKAGAGKAGSGKDQSGKGESGKGGAKGADEGAAQ
ncbi:thioredoxin domain-containing protein [Streptomyces sp. MST-110588]|uniref:DsbA family protein n=1 Tax=Streptomyces sp. MST-110588 TaxID=2833628 RepID=UPI001F5C1166|nr:thioredoxin domain-containing protein [Streptomyces sp. MST-110588]UNO39845.1 thioredoxin domain-containing protein [Streptomyces sp. MST-110588]